VTSIDAGEVNSEKFKVTLMLSLVGDVAGVSLDVPLGVFILVVPPLLQ